MALIVQKFGGTSVANPERILHVVEIVKKEVAAGHKVVVVVSAMSGQTNLLTDYVKGIGGGSPAEQDVVLSSGEQVTAGLMALALQNAGISARSCLGWQVPIETDDVFTSAKISHIGSETLKALTDKNVVAVVPGFQGVTQYGAVTTLGRGGSDTSAVGIAAALKADRCDIYTDVDGVYTADPRAVPKARKLEVVSHEEMLEMATLGAKILHPRSVELAMRYNVSLRVLSSFLEASEPENGTNIRELTDMEHQIVTGITHTDDVAKITLAEVEDRPGVAAKIFKPLADHRIHVQGIVQTMSHDKKTTDVTFIVPQQEMATSQKALEAAKEDIGYKKLLSEGNVSLISIIGNGIANEAGVAHKIFSALAEMEVNIDVISSTSIKVSVLVSQDCVQTVLPKLHTVFGLDTI